MSHSKVRSLLAAFAVVLPGCAASASAPLPPTPPTMKVVMKDFGFEHKSAFPSGRVMMRVENAGPSDHQLMLVRLPKGVEDIQSQIRSPKRIVVETLRTLPTFISGETGIFAVDLTPAKYGFACFLPTGDGTTHAFKGMSSEFAVGP